MGGTAALSVAGKVLGGARQVTATEHPDHGFVIFRDSCHTHVTLK